MIARSPLPHYHAANFSFSMLKTIQVCLHPLPDVPQLRSGMPSFTIIIISKVDPVAFEIRHFIPGKKVNFPHYYQVLIFEP